MQTGKHVFMPVMRTLSKINVSPNFPTSFQGTGKFIYRAVKHDKMVIIFYTQHKKKRIPRAIWDIDDYI